MDVDTKTGGDGIRSGRCSVEICEKPSPRTEVGAGAWLRGGSVVGSGSDAHRE